MIKYFISGSCSINTLSDEVKNFLKELTIHQSSHVIIGDAKGVDTLVQMYLYSLGFSKITVYQTNGKCRNNVGNWETKNIVTDKQKGTREYFTVKDVAMTHDCNIGVVIWDGESKGTKANIDRLQENNIETKVFNIH